VVAALLPFNWPVAVMGNKVLPALLTGNTVVVKAPPTCPGAVLRCVAAMAAELPDGVLNVVNGPHAALGAALVAHPGVDMVSFTGGVATGRAVMAAAAASTKPVVLELGGNDPAILAPDVAFDEALVDKVVGATYVTSGQVCMAIKRLYVPEGRVGEMAEALAARLCAEVVGDGLADGVTMGPVHLAPAAARVEALIAEAEHLGAKVLRPARVREEDVAAGGYFVSPAVVVGPPPTAGIVVEEQFAPALPVLGYRDLDHAVAMANDTEFGLCASVWSNDGALADSVAARLEAGTVFVNAHGMSAMDPSAPMGGWKSSGFGVELGPEGMQAFTRPQVVLHHPAPGS
jgi:acyl-CoA reductase-like NAD-dependent aldehyde dehydrogenase